MAGNAGKWSKIEERYRQRREGDKAGWTDDYTHAEQEIRDFLSRNCLTPAGKFLELGCGAGNRTLIAARMGFDAFGVDFAHEAIAWALKKAALEKVHADFLVGDITALDSYAPSFFDVVYDGGVLYMITDRDERVNCFKNIARVLKPRGLLYATAHLANSNFNKWHDLAAGSWYDPRRRYSTVGGEPAYYFSNEDEFRGEIEGAGLNLLRMEKVSKTDAERPFHAGDMFADACKPDAN